MPQSAQEYVEITSLIKGILNGYPGNSAIFREYLQNSDDARASKQTFVLDERVFPNTRVLDKILRNTQGPALIAANDGKLLPADWASLQTIHASSKVSDSTQTGKNGLGFRASYHLTDNPHIMSDRRLMVLDPHRLFEHHPGGVTFDVIDEGPPYQDHLASFACVASDLSQPFEGTAFRLPLRTEQQARHSKIKSSATSVDEIRQLLYAFAATDLEQAILFLKHINVIEIRHIDSDGEDVLVGRATIQKLDAELRRGGVCREVVWETHDSAPRRRRFMFYYDAVSTDAARSVMSERLGYDVVGQTLTIEKLVPNVELAFPLEGAAIAGALFTLLPLPILTHFPAHLNAVFALTPDRQNLKNSQEVGVPGSRERLLVEWNRLIFDLWAPSAWAALMSTLPPQYLQSPSWSAWPPVENNADCYWKNFVTNVVNEVVRQKLTVWPTVGSAKLVSLADSAALLAPSEPGIALDLLAAYDLDIVQPPPHIFSVLLAISDLPSPVLSPQTLYNVLRAKHLEDLLPFASNTKACSKIISYLVFSASPPTLQHISGLPWFRLASGASVHLGSLSTKYVIPGSKEEARLFSGHAQMISWDCMTAKLRASLRDTQAFGVLNITTLKPKNVISFVRDKLKVPSEPSATEAIRSEDHAWLVDFWAWVVQWDQRAEFIKLANDKIGDLYLLPTTERSLRKLSRKSVVFKGVPQEAVDAWGFYGVYPLHADLVGQAIPALSPVIEVPRNQGYVPLLLRSCNLVRKVSLAQDALVALQDSLRAGLPKKSRESVVLSKRERQKLSELPVFMVRPLDGGQPYLGICGEDPVLIDVADDFPLPQLEDSREVTYIDAKDASTISLMELLKGADSSEALAEFDVLQLAVDNWSSQPMDLQDRFVARIFESFSRLPAKLRAGIADLAFVTVNRKAERVVPRNMIHPTSHIACLYQDEAGRFPTGLFAETEYLLVMEKAGFVASSLDKEIITERLDYLSTRSANARLFEKAMAFVTVLDQFWKADYEPLISEMRSKSWLPLNSSLLESPDTCRDNYHYQDESDYHIYYFDLALNILQNVTIHSLGLRKALGWCDPVPYDVLVEQFRLTIDLPASQERNARLSKLINYFGRLLTTRKLAKKLLADLRGVAHKQQWIPISTSSDGESIAVEYAVLDARTSMALHPPFRHVADLNDSMAFLRKMGCKDRPDLDTLASELHGCQLSSEDGLLAAVALLYEIGAHHRGFQKELISIPTVSNEFASFDAVYFRDMDVSDLSANATGKTAANSLISRTLAELLEIPFLSSLALGEGDDEELSEQMSEDLVGRIRGFLREYDVRYSINEFLANADDAHAREFSVLLDTRSSSSRRVISPEFRALDGVATLVFYNDSQLSENDFKGLRDVGMGGKADQSDTHGRHGLGALSFYYFTDVVTVISGDSVMILDPSGAYLPRIRGRKRTAITRKLAEFSSCYPDQLKAYEDLFQFSNSRASYHGTLFILPLRSTISATPLDTLTLHDLLKTSYRDLAQDAFFFTNLQALSAKERNDATELTVWSISAERSATAALASGYSMHDVTVAYSAGFDARSKESWLITTSKSMQLPEMHDATATALKLVPRSKFCVQLAINPAMCSLRVASSKPTSFLFSTLRLPECTSLPFHVNSRFAISSNRQNVVFDHIQRDPKTAYNTWIIDEVVPPLYFATIEYLLSKNESNVTSTHPLNKAWWLPESSDHIARIARESTLRRLPGADNKLFQDVNEPYRVTKLLRVLKAPGFTEDFRLTDLAGARVADGNFVKGILTQPSALGVVKTLYENGEFDLTDIATILLYIKDEAPFSGVPLLLLQSGELVRVPDSNDRHVYRSSSSSHAALFPSARFLAPGYKEDAIKPLIDAADNNLLDLDELHILNLVADHLKTLADIDTKNEWVQSFWIKSSTLPGQSVASVLQAQNLKIIPSTSDLHSLADCRPDQVAYDRHGATTERAFQSSLTKMGIPIILGTNQNETVKNHLDQKFPPLFDNILRCLAGKDVRNFYGLTKEETTYIAIWLRNEIGNHTNSWRTGSHPPVPKQFINRLPIWEAYNSAGRLLHAADGLRVLPYDLNAQDLHAYLKPGRVVASASLTLVNFLKFYHRIKKNRTTFEHMTARETMDAIRLPASIENTAALRTYKDFLEIMLRFPNQALTGIDVGLRAPDRNRNLRPLNELYDDQTPLFAATLGYTQQSSFMHQNFRDLAGSLGLWQAITLQTFEVCARAVAQALTDHLDGGHSNRPSLLAMTTAAFGAYRTDLPAQIMVNAEAWKLLDDISFVRRQDTRRNGASYDVARYCGDDLPILLPPNRLLKESLEPIAWTQRALFFSEPNEEVLAVNKSLGVPRHEEVVQHLIVLSTEIARDHPGDQTLLSDIKATYKWLNNHSEGAREALLMASAHKMFLNVSDPSVDEWDGQWVEARDLVLNLHYDHLHYKCVRAFLHGYDKFLQAAGCQSMKVFAREAKGPNPATPTSTQFQGLRKTFDDMRKLGELTDVVMVPYSQKLQAGVDQLGGRELGSSDSKERVDMNNEEDDEAAAQDIEVKDSDLRAHRDFLAASIPFVRTSQTKWNTPNEIPFYGTAFGAKALLDFVYTGEFELSKKTSDLHCLARLMRDFLELLPIADEWDMPDLKEKIEWEIIYKHDMIQCLPHEFHTMLHKAKECNATALANALTEFQKLNPMIVRDFAREV